MALSLRDRFFTPPVAHAFTSPTGILALGVGAGLGILSGGGVLAAVVGAAVAYGVRIGLAIPRGATEERIDPFAVGEPWRHYVQDALRAQRRLRDAVHDARRGPLHERLLEIEARVDTGVREVWRIARRGHDLADARKRVDPDAIRREIAATRADAGQPRAAGGALERTMEALQAQLATVERLDRVIVDADSRLRLLNARLDEAAARTIELSVQAHDASDLGGLGRDVDDLVEEMEALRLAIEETSGNRPGQDPGSAVAGPA